MKKQTKGPGSHKLFSRARLERAKVDVSRHALKVEEKEGFGANISVFCGYFDGNELFVPRPEVFIFVCTCT